MKVSLKIMNKGRIVRNLGVIISGAIVLGLSIYIDLKPIKLINYIDIMSASFSFSALATALFFSTFSLIPAFSNSKLIKILEELKTDKKLMDRLLISTVLFFVNSLLAFVALLFDAKETNLMSKIVVIGWGTTFAMAIVSTFLIIFIIFKIFNFYMEQ